jgi:hypothetical protein
MTVLLFQLITVIFIHYIYTGYPGFPVKIVRRRLAGLKDCKSILKKCLTKEIYEQLKDKKTSLGGTLADCIRSGAKNLDSGVGFLLCLVNHCNSSLFVRAWRGRESIRTSADSNTGGDDHVVVWV